MHVAVDQTGRKRNGHPAIEAAKQRALAGVVDGVVAAYVSRFTRNTLYGLTTVAELLDAGRQFFAPECPFDLRTPEGRKYLTGLLAEAEYEGDVKARHFARGVEDAIERGAHLAAPYGLAKGNGKAESLTIVRGGGRAGRARVQAARRRALVGGDRRAAQRLGRAAAPVQAQRHGDAGGVDAQDRPSTGGRQGPEGRLVGVPGHGVQRRLLRRGRAPGDRHPGAVRGGERHEGHEVRRA